MAGGTTRLYGYHRCSLVWLSHAHIPNVWWRTKLHHHTWVHKKDLCWYKPARRQKRISDLWDSISSRKSGGFIISELDLIFPKPMEQKRSGKKTRWWIGCCVACGKAQEMNVPVSTFCFHSFSLMMNHDTWAIGLYSDFSVVEFVLCVCFIYNIPVNAPSQCHTYH